MTFVNDNDEKGGSRLGYCWYKYIIGGPEMCRRGFHFPIVKSSLVQSVREVG